MTLEKKSKKLPLPVKIFIGMILGILCGVLLHTECLHSLPLLRAAEKYLELGGRLFLNMFRMIVVPVVLISMIRGVTAMKNPALLGRAGVKTLIIFAVTTAVSAFMGIIFAFGINIGKGSQVALPTGNAVQTGGKLATLQETIASIVPANIFKSMAEANMLQVIFVAVIVGIALAKISSRSPRLLELLEELDNLNIKIVDLILSVAPYGVFCLLADTFFNFGISVLLPLSKYVGCVVLTIAVLLAVVYPLLLLTAHVSPVKFYTRMAPVMLLAFSTSSSNATLPGNIETMDKKFGVERSLATFILSLGATINMNGTAIMQGCAAVFIAQLYGVNLSVMQIIQVIAMCLIASVGTAGMPGAGVIMLGLVLQSVGLPISGIALVLGVDRIVDMFRTVANITGDSLTAILVDASEKKRSGEPVKANQEC